MRAICEVQGEAPSAKQAGSQAKRLESVPAFDSGKAVMKVGKHISALLSIVLGVSLCVGYLPAQAEDPYSANDAATCVHHQSHTEECGYAEATGGEACAHSHDEECGYVEDVEGSCTHTHDEGCGYADASDEVPCAYAENGCPYCIDSWEWVDEQGALSDTDGGWTMGLPGVNQDNPITRDSLAELLPSQIAATTDDGVKRTLDIAWDLTSMPEEGATEGEYRVTASLADAHYALADGAAPLAVTLQLGGAADYTLEMPSGTPPYSEHIVDGVSPSGTTINLFDYWITGQTDEDDSDPSNLANLGINKDHALLFFKNGKGKWNQWTNSKNVYKGIVQDGLVDGYPKLNLDTSGGGAVQGRDGSESLSYLFDPSVDHEGKESFTDVQGLLQVDDQGYYYYNSQENYAVYYEDTNSFTLYEHPGVIPGGTSPVGQFFPFNEATEDAVQWTSDGSSYTLMNTSKSNVKGINHYFGVHMSTRFIQQYGGHIDKDETREVTYEFSGDDDVWIFIDGTLVGDLGGVHDAASISINFATGEITVNDQVQEKSLGDLLDLESDILADNTYHTLDFFYLERGNTDSNMYLRYNLVTIPESGLIKVDQVGNRVYGAEFALYSAKDYAVEGENAIPVATGTTDSNGSFTFITKDADGGERPVTVSELYDTYGDSKDDQGNNLVLVETKTPPGYRTCGEIGLYFYVPSNGSKEVLLLSSNDSIWNQGAYAMPKVYTTTGNTISIVKDSSTAETKVVDLVGDAAVENPTMFAVVFQKQDDGTWLPVSGDPINGWKVEEDSSWDSVLNAARSSVHIFQLSSSGSYQVEIDDLPGDIKSYYHICKDKEQAQYAVGYYYTEADSLSGATEENTWRIDSESSEYGLERVFSMSLYVTDMKNRLLVQKVDDEGNPVNGAQFSLYKADDVAVTSNADGTQSVVPKEEAVPAVVTTEDIDMPVDLNGGAVFPDDADGGAVLENGEYWLFETSVPAGYKVETEPIHVVVDNTGVYADAGDEGDGITVLRGVGSVARSMVQFAADDGVDITLRDIKAALATGVTFGSYNEDGSFAVSGEGIDWGSSTGEDVLHLQYANANAMLDYGLYGGDGVEPVSIDDLTLATDAGWSMLLVKQCFRHDAQTDISLKTNLSNVEGKDYSDITSLFSGTVTVRVANERTGNLEIGKVVTGDGAPATQEFTFEVTVQDGGANISGTYATLNQNDDQGTITFKDGEATVELKGGESLTILALPAGATFSVKETDVPSSYAASMDVTGDDGAMVENGKVTGTIQHNTSEDAAVKVTCTNTFNGDTTAILKGTKTLEGRDFASADEFTFSLEAYGDATQQAIKDGNVVMPEQKTASVTDAEDGSEQDFSFDSITFKTEGNYSFAIKEVLPEGVSENCPVLNDVLYDTHVSIATVKVTRDDDTGILQATVSYSNAGAPSDSSVTTEAVFVNRWAGLEIAKKVTGAMGDRDKQFDFTIKLTVHGQPLTGAYPCTVSTADDGTPEESATLTLDNEGTAHFELGHDQTITVFGLPSGTEFMVSEPNAEADGYTTTVAVGNASPTKSYEAIGNLSDEATVEVTFENSRSDVPATGIPFDIWPWALLAAFAAGAGALLIRASRRAGKAYRMKEGRRFGR